MNYTLGGTMNVNRIEKLVPADPRSDMPIQLDPAADPQAEAQRKIINRLKRANGQLAAVVAAVESGAHCRDVVQQLSAVSKAIDRAGFLLISTALQECITNPDGETSPEELEKLFLSLT